eukprot:scaffold284026_cov38-Tisochrysis_lutea.AAC.1
MERTSDIRRSALAMCPGYQSITGRVAVIDSLARTTRLRPATSTSGRPTALLASSREARAIARQVRARARLGRRAREGGEGEGGG